MSTRAEPQVMDSVDHAAPRAGGFPLVGLLRERLDYLERLRARHGDIYALDLPGRPIVLCHPAHGQRVLRDHAANYRKGGGFWQVLRELLGDGIVVSEGERWLRQRRLMQPQFHRRRIVGMAEAVIQAIDGELARWPAPTQRLDVCARMSALTMQVITRTMFGDHVDQGEIDTIARELPIVLGFTTVGVLTHGLPSWAPVPGRRRFRAAKAAIRELVAGLIARRRASGLADDTLLALLAEAVDADTGERMSDTQLLDEAVGIFVAGYETTALGLAWAIHALLQNPSVMARLEAEVDAALGDRPLTYADLARMPYTRQVLLESLRLYPPASWLPRVAVADDVIDGVRIPAGATVILPIYTWHRHPDMWADPERFDPSRFEPERASRRHSFAYAPFGGGQRLCIGKELALLEGQAALAAIFRRFRLAPVDDRVVRAIPSATLTPQGGVWARLRGR
ncbi:MAG: cytochrome P450 [Nannocystaceae bacterium]